MKNKKILITGANGQLGRALQEVFLKDNVSVAALSRADLDITDPDKLKEWIDQIRPHVIINTAAYNHVDEAEKDPQKAFDINTRAVETLASLCREKKIFFIHYSTDYVFDGAKAAPYTEEDSTRPLSQYAQSKLQGEQAVQGILTNFLLLRLSWVYGRGAQNFLSKLMTWAKEKDVLEVAQDEISVPTSALVASRITLKALSQGLSGLYHAVNGGQCSRYDWAKLFCEQKGINVRVVPASQAQFHLPAQRPLYSAMSNQKISLDLKTAIAPWQESLKEFVHDLSERTA